MFPTLFLKVLGRMVQYGIYNLLSTFMLMINGLLHNLRFVKKISKQYNTNTVRSLLKSAN
jgi:hypothetical protein